MKLELNKVCRSFDCRHALLDASASFEKLQSLVLIGPTGGGKSTLLRIIAGLETPDSGSVIVNEKRIAFDEASLVLHRRDIGVVFQSFNLFPHLTALENLLLPLTVATVTARRTPVILPCIFFRDSALKGTPTKNRPPSPEVKSSASPLPAHSSPNPN